jgi:hypothetical protein
MSIFEVQRWLKKKNENNVQLRILLKLVKY